MGPTGSGKTYTALAIAEGLGKRVALIDTEHGAAGLYSDRFDFQTLELETYAPAKYIDALDIAAKEGFDVVIIDSLSHAWSGKGGVLEQVDAISKRNPGQNSFTSWRDGTKTQTTFVEALLSVPFHLIGTMRSKMDWVMEENSKGKMVPKKVGLAPVQRDDLLYEADLIAEIDHEHNFMVTKTRFADFDGFCEKNVGRKFGEKITGFLKGAPKPPEEKAPVLFMSREHVKRGQPLRGATIEEVEDYILALDNKLLDATDEVAVALKPHRADVHRELAVMVAERTARETQEHFAGGSRV